MFCRTIWLAQFVLSAMYLSAQADEQPQRRATGYLASSRAQRRATLVDPAWRRAWQGPPSESSAAPTGSAKGELVLRTAQAPEALPPGRTMPEVVPAPRQRRPANAQLELPRTAEGNWNLEQLTELALE
ncbi:MAG TPA: hypothetical protein VGX76_16060, partial [Pirellulales bacterium]|nr:hypothetical protein [Pirellulales bacterium]